MKNDAAGKDSASVSARGKFAILAESNRGILFDVVIFLINVFLMQLLTGYFLTLVQNASAGDKFAIYATFTLCIGVFVLPPLGATLKRWHFHRRMKAAGKTADTWDKHMTGCLFNPIFYFTLNIVIISAILAFITEIFFGRKEPPQWAFMSLLFSGIAFIIIQTVLVYRYFSAPRRAPKSAFLRHPLSELLGDICILVNMLLFQLAWNFAGEYLPGGGYRIEDILGRLFLLVFIALLIYFPPRIFFLAEDIKRPTAWISILLANSPVIYRMLMGSGSH